MNGRGSLLGLAEVGSKGTDMRIKPHSSASMVDYWRYARPSRNLGNAARAFVLSKDSRVINGLARKAAGSGNRGKVR